MTNVFDQIVSGYRRGRIVPFIGAGMSAGVCRGWESFVDALEAQAGPGGGSTDPIQRAAHAVWTIRARGERLGDVVRAVLSNGGGTSPPPPQTEALAALTWPLVVTTNYDDLYVEAAHHAHLERNPKLRTRQDRWLVPLLLLGRSAADCQRVLTSLRQPDVPILWAVQGFVGGQARSRLGADANSADFYAESVADANPDYEQRTSALGNELVVGHAEYRRVALMSQPFRRAFAELHRSRSLFFLGSGLREHYFLDLFSEIVELYGLSPEPHFAILPRGQADTEFLRHYFGIWIHEIDDHRHLPHVLEEIGDPDRGRPRSTCWIFSSAASSRLSIVREGLRQLPLPQHCLVFSAGGRTTLKHPGNLKLSGIGREFLGRNGLDATETAFARVEGAEGSFSVWHHRCCPAVLAVDVRIDPWSELGARVRPTDPRVRPIGPNAPTREATSRDRRDARGVPPAVEMLMEVTQKLGFVHAHTMLLSAGPLRTYPASRTIMQMVRGWSRWSSRAGDGAPDLSIYVVQPEVLRDLDSQRLDVHSCLMADVLDFWLEVVMPDGQEQRLRVIESAHTRVVEMLASNDITNLDARLDVVPPPCLHWGGWTLRAVATWEQHFGTSLTLETFGLLPGATLAVRLVS